MQTLTLVGIAALAWAGVIAYARHMGNGVGTMGLGLGEFVAMWALMMTAMMLPAVAPVATLYSATVTDHRARRLTLFVGGYLLVWAAVGIPAYLLLRLVDDHTTQGDATIRTIAVVVLAAAGIYQLTPMKRVCLRHCRSPLAQLLHYGNTKGPLRDLKVAVHHAGFCLGCCWALMVLFVAFGVMNVWFMFALAALVVLEKVWRHGEQLGRAAGVAFLVLALSIAVSATVADGVLPTSPDTTMSGGM